MAKKIQIKMPKQYLDIFDKKDAELELRDVQEYFDTTSTEFEPDTISFIFLRGVYSHINRKTFVVGVFINSLHNTVLAFSGNLEFTYNKLSGIDANMEVFLSNEFIEELLPGEGIIIHLEVPTVGFLKDETLETVDVRSTFSNIEYATLKSQEEN